jgi:hypothetical protein
MSEPLEATRWGQLPALVCRTRLRRAMCGGGLVTVARVTPQGAVTVAWCDLDCRNDSRGHDLVVGQWVEFDVTAHPGADVLATLNCGPHTRIGVRLGVVSTVTDDKVIPGHRGNPPGPGRWWRRATSRHGCSGNLPGSPASPSSGRMPAAADPPTCTYCATPRDNHNWYLKVCGSCYDEGRRT